MDNFKFFIIENITNMHVGNGDINFNIIDNEVQRDVITNFPAINPSSLKGALREFCKEKLSEDKINHIFGDEERGVGKYKFFGASLLSIPVRSNIKPFFRATCPLIIKEFLDTTDNFLEQTDLSDFKNLESIFDKVYKKEEGILLTNTNEKDIKVEGYDVVNINDTKMNDVIMNLEKIFGEDLVLFDDAVFKNIVKELPVIARNKLENGTSKNLWYEEVVPRKTRFYFGIIEDKYEKLTNKDAEFFNELITNNVVQFGANATIGYGYCNIKPILTD